MRFADEKNSAGKITELSSRQVYNKDINETSFVELYFSEAEFPSGKIDRYEVKIERITKSSATLTLSVGVEI